MVKYNSPEAIEAAITPNTCAVLLEPIQGEAGVFVPADGYLRAVREICTRHNVLFIADEIQTGFCRTGRKFAVDHEDVRPDAMTLGKALGGGLFPVSAVVAEHDVMGVFTPGSHGSTFGGNPLAAAVGMAALDVLDDEKLADNARKMGEYFRREIAKVKCPKMVQVRGKGLLNAVVFEKGFEAWDVPGAPRRRRAGQADPRQHHPLRPAAGDHPRRDGRRPEADHPGVQGHQVTESDPILPQPNGRQQPGRSPGFHSEDGRLRIVSPVRFACGDRPGLTVPRPGR